MTQYNVEATVKLIVSVPADSRTEALEMARKIAGKTGEVTGCYIVPQAEQESRCMP